MPGGSPNHDQALPNKLFEYLHAGLPLVVADAKLMADFVRSNCLGEVFRSGDPAGLADAVRRALEPGRPHAARADLAARYSWQAQEGKIADLYDRVMPVPDGLRVAADRLPARFPDLHVHAGAPAGVEDPHPTQSLESTSPPTGEPLQHTVNRGSL
jgi:hypothetical protein